MNQVTLNEKEARLIAYLLKLASAEFSEHGCNDLDVTQVGFTQEDSDELWKKIGEWDDPDLADIEAGGNTTHYDWILMIYFSEEIRKRLEGKS